MRLLLRCDASPAGGAGHLVRSLSVAEAARAAGHEVLLAGRAEAAGWVLDRLQELGVPVVTPPAWSQLGSWAAEHGFDALHVDDYDAPSGLRSACRAAEVVLSNVEDGHWGRRPADVVLDPSLGAEEALRPADGSALLLRGAAQSLLRPSVRRGRVRRSGRTPPAEGNPLGVVVVMGGTDAAGGLSRVLDLLARAATVEDLPRVQVLAVTTAMNALNSARRRGLEVNAMLPGPELVEAMSDADLVVTAAGSTVAELCCIGVPMAVVPIVDNQVPGYGEVVRRRLGYGLGQPGELGLASNAGDVLHSALSSASRRAEVSAHGTTLVDGSGTARLLRAIEDAVDGPEPFRPALFARPAVLADAAALLEWRNDPLVRASSRERERIDASAHVGWMASVLASPRRRLLLVEDSAAQMVGSVRWDAVDAAHREWEVSIMLAPHVRGRGWGGRILAAGEQHLMKEKPSAGRVTAVVHRDNDASSRMFLRAGYVETAAQDGDGFRRLTKRIG